MIDITSTSSPGDVIESSVLNTCVERLRSAVVASAPLTYWEDDTTVSAMVCRAGEHEVRRGNGSSDTLQIVHRLYARLGLGECLPLYGGPGGLIDACGITPFSLRGQIMGTPVEGATWVTVTLPSSAKKIAARRARGWKTARSRVDSTRVAIRDGKVVVAIPRWVQGQIERVWGQWPCRFPSWRQTVGHVRGVPRDTTWKQHHTPVSAVMMAYVHRGALMSEWIPGLRDPAVVTLGQAEKIGRYSATNSTKAHRSYSRTVFREVSVPSDVWAWLEEWGAERWMSGHTALITLMLLGMRVPGALAGVDRHPMGFALGAEDLVETYALLGSSPTKCIIPLLPPRMESIYRMAQLTDEQTVCALAMFSACRSTVGASHHTRTFLPGDNTETASPYAIYCANPELYPYTTLTLERFRLIEAQIYSYHMGLQEVKHRRVARLKKAEHNVT